MTNFIQIYGPLFATLLRIVALIITLIFLLPLQIKEAQVKNGLRKLRLQLLWYGIILFHMNIITSFVLFQVFENPAPESVLTAWLQIINSVGMLVLAIIGYSIYHQQYTPENKELHEQAAEKETTKQ